MVSFSAYSPDYAYNHAVDCGELLRQVLVSRSSLAAQMKPFIESNMMSTCTVELRCGLVR